MNLLLIALLVVAGLLLCLVEVFLIPGFGIAGMASIACIGYAIYCAFAISIGAGILTIVVSALGVVGIICWFMKSKTVDRLSLKKSLDYVPNPLEGTNIKKGSVGIALTRLALIGNAEFDGHEIEVRSADGFLDEKTKVIVTRITEGTVYVKQLQD